MRILYVAMKYDYGRPDQGLSFEHCNFYDSLLRMGHDILYFDFMTLFKEHGKESMNRLLAEVARVERPDLIFSVLFKDELDPTRLREVSDRYGVATLNWFCDDHWRFDNYSCRWAPCFTWIVTTAASALPKYAALGYRNVIKSQWACNHSSYRKMDLPLRYDVTFVGQPHGNRQQMIQSLRHAGISVRVWGRGWESGRISQDEMIRVFNQSRINLNLANASMPVAAAAAPVEHATVAPSGRMRTRISRTLDKIPFGSRVKAVGKAWLRTSGDTASVSDGSEATENSGVCYSEQIKGRNFEVPGCGGFVLTGRAENLEQYYENGKEVVIFDDRNDLIEKIRYYLRHESERAAIARAGYDRTLREHTYALRFRDIFRQMGMAGNAVGHRADAEVQPGTTHEVK
ncbi:MAG: glycosyltransferase [Nitrospira sp.]|nr:glycosyltransferase [Nitrospira sp.]